MAQRLHTLSKISILLMLAVALASAQLDWARARAGLYDGRHLGAFDHWGRDKTGLLYLGARERDFRLGYGGRGLDWAHREDELRKAIAHGLISPTRAAELGLGLSDGRGVGLIDPITHQKPLVVYSGGLQDGRWNGLGARAYGYGDPRVSAIIRAPNARLLAPTADGKPTVLVSGPLGPRPRPVVDPVTGVIHREDDGSLLPPKPYAFAFDTHDEFNNKMARHEEKDETGRVTGSYSYLDANGQTRLVNYVADEAGFRAEVKTNEHGTATSAPAGAVIDSSAPEVPHPEVVAPLVPRPSVAPIVPTSIAPRAYGGGVGYYGLGGLGYRAGLGAYDGRGRLPYGVGAWGGVGHPLLDDPRRFDGYGYKKAAAAAAAAKK